MKHRYDRRGLGIEVAHLVSGEVISVRVLSARAERRAALAAAATVLGLTALAVVAATGVLRATGRVAHVGTFAGIWAALGFVLTALAARTAAGRASRYLVGIDIDDDAYAPTRRALVSRGRHGFELGLAPGMRGVVEAGPAPLDVEALLRAGRTSVPLDGSARAEITMSATTFVVRVLAPSELQAPAALPRGFRRPFARRALPPLQLAGLAVFFLSVPLRAPIGEAEMRSAIPADASPWDVEKLLREEAQKQARSLHACFDPLPLTCQHPGYVGVGLSLEKDGEIRSSWIARSTYGRDCPVEACMSNVVSSWFFEPIPEAMRIVLPVQVLRTDKPIPVQHASLEPRPELP
ncbi:MAG TPA: hypothetical protein VHL80_00800 [Polyangia bacterium]|nr:hypothetical protein [Polyangia bacterium]